MPADAAPPDAPAGSTARTGRSTVVFTVANIGAQLVNVVAMLVVARAAGPASFGTQSAVLGVALLGVLALDHGASTPRQREVARDRATPSAVSFVRRRALLVALVVLTGVLVGAGWQVVGAAVAYAGTLTLAQSMAAIGRGRDAFGRVSVALVADKVSTLLAAVALVAVGVPEHALLLSLLVGTVVQCLVLATCVSGDRPRLLLRRPARGWAARWVQGVRADVRAGAPFFGLSVLFESQRLDVPLVAWVAGATQAGLFAAPARLTGPMGVVANSAAQVMLTHLSGDPAAPLGRRARQVAGLVVAGYVVLAGLIALLAPFAVDLVLGPEYSGTAAILVVYGITMVPISVNQLLSSVLAARNQERRTLVRAAVTAPLSLVLVLVGAFVDGAFGAAFAALTAQTLLMLLLVGPARASGRRASGRRAGEAAEAAPQVPTV